MFDYRSPYTQPKPFENWKRFLTEPVVSQKAEKIGEWTPAERESLKRFMLVYGYGRWNMIRDSAKNAGYNLDDKSDEDMTHQANSFLCAVLE